MQEQRFIDQRMNRVVASNAVHYGIVVAIGEPVAVASLAVPTLSVIIELPIDLSTSTMIGVGLTPKCAQLGSNGTILDERTCFVVSASPSSVTCTCKSTTHEEFHGAVVVVFEPSRCTIRNESCAACTAAPGCGWCGATATCAEGTLAAAFFPAQCESR